MPPPNQQARSHTAPGLTAFVVYWQWFGGVV